MFFSTLAFAFLEPFFFIGYLISIALFGLFQAIFMANAGGAWDNAKKLVEVELKEKGTALHAATVVGDTVGDPFKDTSSVAMNPIIKFTTLFGLLAVEIAVGMSRTKSLILSGCFLAVSMVFVWRSFYAMRITTAKDSAVAAPRRQARKRLARASRLRLVPGSRLGLRPGPQRSAHVGAPARPPGPKGPITHARERGLRARASAGRHRAAVAVIRAATFEPARNRCERSPITLSALDLRLTRGSKGAARPAPARRLFGAPRTRGHEAADVVRGRRSPTCRAVAHLPRPSPARPSPPA